MTAPPSRFTRITPSSKGWRRASNCRDWKLAEFIEEQHAVGGQTCLAGSERQIAAADERDDRGLMVRGTKWCTLHERTFWERRPRRRMKSGDGQRLLQRERRKQAWQSLRQHRLARPWRSNQK